MWKLKRLRWPHYSLARSIPCRRTVLRGRPDAWLCSDSCGVHVAVRIFKRGVHAIAAVSIAALSSSCVLTGDLPNLSLDVPQRYKAAEPLKPDGETPALDWWRGFRWNELTQLMEEAQTVNLDIASAVSRIRQADAQARIAGAPLLPNISGTGSETHSLTSGSSSSGLTSGRREAVSYQASLSASYELDFWSKNRDAARAAEETVVASRFDRDVVALTTLTSTANAYFQVLSSQDRLRVAERNIAGAQRILEAIKQRLNAGTGNDLDVAQQESVLANQRALVPPLRQTLQQNINALATLVSRPPENIKVIGSTLDHIAIPRVSPGLPSELLTQRPDIRRQEAKLAAATANIGNARAQFFPSIQLTGQGGYQSSALSTLFQPHAAFFNLVGSATQPIFDGGRILGNFEFAKARQDELLQTYRKTVVQTFADVDNALTNVRETTIKLRLQRAVVAASRRAFQLAADQLRAGTTDVVTVMNVQITLFQAEDVLVQAHLARLQAIIGLYQALGGGSEPRVKGSINAL